MFARSTVQDAADVLLAQGTKDFLALFVEYSNFQEQLSFSFKSLATDPSSLVSFLHQDTLTIFTRIDITSQTRSQFSWIVTHGNPSSHPTFSPYLQHRSCPDHPTSSGHAASASGLTTSGCGQSAQGPPRTHAVIISVRIVRSSQ